MTLRVVGRSGCCLSLRSPTTRVSSGPAKEIVIEGYNFCTLRRERSEVSSFVKVPAHLVLEPHAAAELAMVHVLGLLVWSSSTSTCLGAGVRCQRDP